MRPSLALEVPGVLHRRLHTVKYPLDRFQDALDDLAAGNVRGCAILVP